MTQVGVARHSAAAAVLGIAGMSAGDDDFEPRGRWNLWRISGRGCPLSAGERRACQTGAFEQFRTVLEAERPDVVFTHWPIDNHADHRAISMLVYDAWLRMKKSFALYFYEVSNGSDTVQFTPTHYVDISALIDRKRAACYAHASQTPDRFYALQEAVTRMRGIERGTSQAEGFIRHVQSPDFALPLVS